MARDINRRLERLERIVHGSGRGIFAVMLKDGEPLYSDCFGERRYFTLDEFKELYPDATIVRLAIDLEKL